MKGPHRCVLGCLMPCLARALTRFHAYVPARIGTNKCVFAVFLLAHLVSIQPLPSRVHAHHMEGMLDGPSGDENGKLWERKEKKNIACGAYCAPDLCDVARSRAGTGLSFTAPEDQVRTLPPTLPRNSGALVRRLQGTRTSPTFVCKADRAAPPKRLSSRLSCSTTRAHSGAGCALQKQRLARLA